MGDQSTQRTRNWRTFVRVAEDRAPTAMGLAAQLAALGVEPMEMRVMRDDQPGPPLMTWNEREGWK
jgi:hypothetical protein